MARRRASARGATVANGIGMLVHQAALQLETAGRGEEAPVEAMWAGGRTAERTAREGFGTILSCRGRPPHCG